MVIFGLIRLDSEDPVPPSTLDATKCVKESPSQHVIDTRYQTHTLGQVFAHHHAARWRLDDFGRTEQDKYRAGADYASVEHDCFDASNGPAGLYGHVVLRQHVDLVCGLDMEFLVDIKCGYPIGLAFKAGSRSTRKSSNAEIIPN